MKNFNTLLKKTNLKPKERILLLVANQVSEDRDGKRILTDADIHAIATEWQPKDNDEIREYNRYNEGWKLAGIAELDAQTVYLEAKVAHFKKFFILKEFLFYPFNRDINNKLKLLETIKLVDNQEANEIFKLQKEQKLKDGLALDYAEYKLAFETLADEDKKRFKDLYEDIETDQSFIKDEDILTDLFNGKDELTKEDKEKLAELVVKRAYNSFVKHYQFFNYFACIPLYDIGKRFIKDNSIAIEGDITPDDITKALTDYTNGDRKKADEVLKETFLKMLDEDLFKEHTPLVISDDKDLTVKWSKSKEQAKETIKKLIDKGELKTQDDGKTITGESLYNFKGDYKFIKDFKENADHYDPNLGIVFADSDKEHKDHLDKELLICDKDKEGEPSLFSLYGLAIKHIKGIFEATQFIKEDNEVIDIRDDAKEGFFKARQTLIDNYATLLSFGEIFERLNKIYELDLGYRIRDRIKEVSEFIDSHNDILETAKGNPKDGEFKTAQGKLFTDLKEANLKIIEDLYINKDKIQPKMDERISTYLAEFKKVLKDEF